MGCKKIFKNVDEKVKMHVHVLLEFENNGCIVTK